MKRLFGMNKMFAVVLAAHVLGGLAIQSARAGTITWGAPVTVSGTTDIDTVGTLFQAANFAGSDTTVNGVLFSGFNVPDGNGTVGNIGITGGQNITTFGGGGDNPYAALPSSYQELLSTGIIFGATVTIQNLTIGSQYSIQFMANDSRIATGSQDRKVFLNTNEVTLDINSDNAGGGVGQWVRGTFTADSTTQSFTVGGSNHAYSNAMQVRVLPVPEPGMLAGLGVVGTGLAELIRRRRRRLTSAS